MFEMKLLIVVAFLLVTTIGQDQFKGWGQQPVFQPTDDEDIDFLEGSGDDSMENGRLIFRSPTNINDLSTTTTSMRPTEPVYVDVQQSTTITWPTTITTKIEPKVEPIVSKRTIIIVAIACALAFIILFIIVCIIVQRQRQTRRKRRSHNTSQSHSPSSDRQLYTAVANDFDQPILRPKV